METRRTKAVREPESRIVGLGYYVFTNPQMPPGPWGTFSAEHTDLR